MMFHEPDFALARLIIRDVLKRFRADADNLNRFVALIRDHAQLLESAPTLEQSIRNNESLLSELNSLFTGENKDLMENINRLWDMAAADPVVVVMMDEESSNVMTKECTEFVNRIKQTLSADKYTKFLEIMEAYKHDRDAEHLQREVSPLLKEHPGLEITLGGEFLAGTPVQEMLAFRKRKRDRLERLKNRAFKVRELGRAEISRFRKEDKMQRNEAKYNTMLCAQDSLQKLLDYYPERNAIGVLQVRDYLKGLDLIYLRKKFEERGYALLNNEQVEARKAISEAHKIIRRLKRKMDNITEDWEDKRKEFTISSHKDASEIKMFDPSAQVQE